MPVFHHLRDLLELFLFQVLTLEADDAVPIRFQAIDERVEEAVEDDPPSVNDDHFLAEVHDVMDIMRSQNDCDILLFLIRPEKLPEVDPGNDVEPDGGLVEEQDLRPVQERHDELALHALAERELADGGIEHMLYPKELGEGHERLVPLRARDLVQVAVEDEGVRRRQIPDELRFLSHHERDLLLEGALAVGGDEAQNAAGAARRREDAGEHLECRGLARPIGPQKSHEATLGDTETDAPYGMDIHPFPPYDAPECPEEAGIFLVVTVRSLQILADDRVVGRRFRRKRSYRNGGRV